MAYECILCGKVIDQRGMHFLCRSCAVNDEVVSEGDYGRLCAVDTYFSALPLTAVPHFDNPDIARGVKDRLAER